MAPTQRGEARGVRAGGAKPLCYAPRVPIRLARSLLRETTGLFLLGVAAVSLLLSIDLLSVLARFLIEQQAGPATVARLLAVKVPWFLHLSLPVAAVFAVLVTGGRMARDSELKAAQAGGIPPRALLVPLVLWGLAISALATVNNGMIEPRAEADYQRIIDEFLYGRPPAASERDVSYLLDGTIFHAARLRAVRGDPDSAELDGVLVRLTDGTLLTATRGTWDAVRRTWRLQAGWRLAPGRDPARHAGTVLAFPLDADPQDTLAREGTLSLGELRERISERTRAGADASGFRFDFHRRLADAAGAAVFTLAAGAVAMRVRGRATGVAWTIALVAVFWAAWTLSGTMFDRGVLGPLTAAWATPGLVAAVALGTAVWSDAT